MILCSIRKLAYRLTAAVVFTSLFITAYSISDVFAGDLAAVQGEERAYPQTVAQPAEHTHDLPIVSLKAPKKVTLSSKKPTVVTTVKVAIQNRSSNIETIPDQNTLTNLVSLTVVAQNAGSSCSTPVPVLHTGKPQPVFPVTLKPNKKLKIVFDVTFTCALDPLKGSGHEDFRYVAQVDASALDGQEDVNPASDICPRSPITLVDGSKPDKGCGGKLPSKTLGGPVLSDVVIKSGGGGGSSNKTGRSAEPVHVADLSGVTAVTSGRSNSCAIDLTGQAWCWGANDYGQLGCSAGTVAVTGNGTPHTATPCAVNSGTQSMQLTNVAAGSV